MNFHIKTFDSESLFLCNYVFSKLKVGGFLFKEVEAEESGAWTQSTSEGAVAILEARELNGSLQVIGEIITSNFKPSLHLASRTLAASLPSP